MAIDPLYIGDIKLKSPVLLAPMSGVSDLPFRRMVGRFGAGLIYSEMIASRIMMERVRNAPKGAVVEGIDYAQEFPLAVQLVGCEPDEMAEGARINEARGAAIIDINFGCPVRKIVSGFAGSALMRDEDKAIAIVEAVVDAVQVPVSVKMRLGWDDESLNAPALARKAQDVGAKMITVHGRTRAQMYGGVANWGAVRQVVAAVDVPVVVNGDICSPQAALEALEQSGAQGVMVGRAACGKPWLLKQIMQFLDDGRYEAAPERVQICALLKEHYEAIIAHYGVRIGVGIARKHIAWYVADMAGAKDFCACINKLDDPQEVLRGIDVFFSAAD